MARTVRGMWPCCPQKVAICNYGRSATSIENKSTIEYGTEQGLAALIYGEQGVSSLPIQDIRGEYIDTDNEYMYYYSVEFIK